MPRSKEKLRLFVASYPTENAARKMLSLLGDLDLPEHRVTPLDQVHLTVHFVGSVRGNEVGRIDSSIGHAIRGIESFEVNPVQLVTLPPRGPAKVLAIKGTASPSLAELHRRLVTRLADTSQKKRDHPYLPHFTLCRFTSPTRMRIPVIAIDLPVLRFKEIRLMKSNLTPSGALHEEMARYELA